MLQYVTYDKLLTPATRAKLKDFFYRGVKLAAVCFACGNMAVLQEHENR